MCNIISDIFIEAREVEYVYYGNEGALFPALSGINLEVNKGEHIALVGPNGSGKTTLLKLFNALILPSSGSVTVEGLLTTDKEALQQIRKKCGMIFQNPDNQLVATTVEEDIAFGLENMALPPDEIKMRVNEVSKIFGLEGLLKHPPHLLSGGEKQRVAIAGTFAMRPDCILMDEPTAMLDPVSRNEVLSTVSTLNEGFNITIINVTHNPFEAALADRVIVLSEGVVIRDGSPEKVLTELDLLHKLGLKGTVAAELAGLLREDGLQIPPTVVHNRELLDYLCTSELKS